MRRAGRVIGNAQGVAVLRSEAGERPDIGETVVDEHLHAVGRIVDVFGPVEQPYVAVTPISDRSPESLLSSVLYLR